MFDNGLHWVRTIHVVLHVDRHGHRLWNGIWYGYVLLHHLFDMMIVVFKFFHVIWLQ